MTEAELKSVEDRYTERIEALQAALDAERAKTAKWPSEWMKEIAAERAKVAGLAASAEKLLACIHDSDLRPEPSAMRMVAIVSGRKEHAAIDELRGLCRAAKEGTVPT